MPDLDELKRQRRTLGVRIENLRQAETRLRSLQGDVDKAQRNLADHDADAADALRQWAAEAGEGDDPPVGDPLERTGLIRALGRAQAAAAQAGSALDDVAAQARQAATDLAAINGLIEAQVLDQLQVEHREAVDKLTAFFVAQVQPQIAHVCGLNLLLIERSRRHQNSGCTDAATALFRRAEVVRATRPDVEVNPSDAEMSRAATAWATRYAALMSDEPPKNVVSLSTLSGAAA